MKDGKMTKLVKRDKYQKSQDEESLSAGSSI